MAKSTVITWIDVSDGVPNNLKSDKEIKVLVKFMIDNQLCISDAYYHPKEDRFEISYFDEVERVWVPYSEEIQPVSWASL